MAFTAQHTRSLGSAYLPSRRVTPSLALRAVQKDVDISTKDWRAQKMAETVRVFFDRVWSRGEVSNGTSPTGTG